MLADDGTQIAQHHVVLRLDVAMILSTMDRTGACLYAPA